MRNPFRWLLRRRVEASMADPFELSAVGAEEDTGATREGGGGPTEPASSGAQCTTGAEAAAERETTAPAGLELELSALGEKLQHLERKLTEAERRSTARLGVGVDEIGRLTAGAEKRLNDRLGVLESQLSAFREQVAEGFARIEEALRGLVERDAARSREARETSARIDAVEKGVGRLADAFEHQLSQTEATLAAVRESSERHLAELRESHHRQFELIEEARRESEAAEAELRDQFGVQLFAVAERLERDAHLPVPVVRGRRGGTPAGGSWGAKLLRAWMERRERAARLRELEQRLGEIEASVRAREEENVELGRRLREAWATITGRTTGAVPAGAETAETAETEQSFDGLAQELRNRRGALFPARAASAMG